MSSNYTYHGSNSPVMVLTPNQEHQAYPYGIHYLDHRLDPSLFNGDSPPTSAPAHHQLTPMTDLSTTFPTSTTTTSTKLQSAIRKPVRPHFPRPPSLHYTSKEPSSLAGRKRSLADVREGEQEPDVDGSEIRTPAVPSPPKSRGEPVFGQDPTLIYLDNASDAIAVESQNGTWVEEKSDQAEAVVAAERPLATSRKLQRRNDSQSKSISVDPIDALNAAATSGAEVNGHSPSPSSGLADTPVDSLSLMLGISWKRIPSSQAPAVKGWEKYILNHYDNIPDHPTILLHSEAHHLYLVRSLSSASDTQECWWVFQEDLSACKLVGFCEQDAIRNLQRGETLGPCISASRESRRPSMGENQYAPALQDARTTAWPTTANGAAPPAAISGDVEMEM